MPLRLHPSRLETVWQLHRSNQLPMNRVGPNRWLEGEITLLQTWRKWGHAQNKTGENEFYKQLLVELDKGKTSTIAPKYNLDLASNLPEYSPKTQRTGSTAPVTPLGQQVVEPFSAKFSKNEESVYDHVIQYHTVCLGSRNIFLYFWFYVTSGV